MGVDQTWTEGLLMGLEEAEKKFVLRNFKAKSTDESEATDELEKYIMECPWDKKVPLSQVNKISLGAAAPAAAKPAITKPLISGLKPAIPKATVAVAKPAVGLKRPL